MSNLILDGIVGLAVADAIGVPVEFNDRESLWMDPVVDIRSYGTYNQPEGTWSDDTSMTLCLIESLTKRLDYRDIMDNFLKWFNNGEYTAHDELFDIGNTTSEALIRYSNGISPIKCGGISEYDNGNGSLMRILPILFYIEDTYGKHLKNNKEVFETIHNISSLTHAHKRSHIACGIYILVASEILHNESLSVAIKRGIDRAFNYYKELDDYKEELKHFSRLMENNFKDLNEDMIKSGGYVVDTLESAIWCLLNTQSCKECVLKAVNLGGDTDTTAAITGGLAGLKYGYSEVPGKRKETLVRRDYIKSFCNNLYNSLNYLYL